MGNAEYVFRGVQDAIKALREQEQRIDLAVKFAANAIGAEAEFAMKSKIANRHEPGTKTGARPGEPPWSVTTRLKSTIKYDVTRRGFGNYLVQVGPTQIYARRLELGVAGNEANTRYPFVAPTYSELIASGRLSAIWIQTLRRAIS